VPDHLEAREIVAGNAVLEASTFLAILTGTIAGGMLAGVEDGVKTACEWLVVLSLAGVVSSMRIPASGPFAPQLKLNLNPLSSTVAIVRDALANPVLRRTIIGISWFWLLGAAFLSQFPAYGKDVLGGSEQVVTLLLSAFSIGIAAGSFLAHRLLKETLSTRYVMASMLAMSVFIADIYLAQPVMADEGLHDISGFLAHAANWRILFDLVMIAISGGVYIVPLNAILQTQAQPESRARMIAANNIMNALFMFSASALLAVGLWAGFSIPQLFLALGGMNLLVGFYMRRLTLSAA
jgi:acyl-[acyl-carrier-protein]-phospholipid O-acyltransferase/long-chain-fatty-acid--[acyl-carrier-protein] ligase